MNGALYDLHASPLEKYLGLHRIRAELLAQARGKTLEIGAGTGRNFDFYPPGLEVHAMEPDAGMRKRAERRVTRYPGAVLGDADAERLPFAEQSFDTAVATLALCSVDDLDASLREIHRVLKPGGRLLALEHVRKDAIVVGKIQDLLNPGWKRLSGGCHLNLRLAEGIARSAFKVERHETLWGGAGGTWVLFKP